jgi:integrase
MTTCISRRISTELSHAPAREDRVGSLWQENGLVSASDIGTLLNRHNLTQRSFRPLLKKGGLTQIRFHDLRHTCATILLSKGVHPKFVQELLGHSTISITIDTYTHVLPGMNGGTADALDEALD